MTGVSQLALMELLGFLSDDLAARLPWQSPAFARDLLVACLWPTAMTALAAVSMKSPSDLIARWNVTLTPPLAMARIPDS